MFATLEFMDLYREGQLWDDAAQSLDNISGSRRAKYMERFGTASMCNHEEYTG